MNPEKDSSDLRQIRTFQGDVAEALQKQRESLYSIHEKERARGGPISSTPSRGDERGLRFYMVTAGSILLMLIGVVGTWFVYGEFVKKTALPDIETVPGRLVSASSEETVDITSANRDSLITSIAGSSINLPRGEVKHIILEKAGSDGKNSLATFEDFAKTLKASPSGSLIRALNPTFMLGFLDGSVFIVADIASFENAFARMLAWEKSMNQDIGAIFSTAGELKNIAPETGFSDITDRNKDMRALLSPEGKPLLLYSFLNNETLIITDNIDTLRSLLDRLTREKLSR